MSDMVFSFFQPANRVVFGKKRQNLRTILNTYMTRLTNPVKNVKWQFFKKITQQILRVHRAAGTPASNAGGENDNFTRRHRVAEVKNATNR